jgi:hypothetical protein
MFVKICSSILVQKNKGMMVDFFKKTSILESILQLVLEGKKAPNFG